MKKFLVAAIFIITAIVAQACGGAEKCPAYTAVDQVEDIHG
jgi:hypothetical protein